MLLLPHPDMEVTCDSGSLTPQLSDTLPTYQPLDPSVPLTTGWIKGADESHVPVTLNEIDALTGLCFSPDQAEP
jgi:hypothetical protein